jgi:5S rRNA maturation endonuclease (ribonuclease M5)
MTFDEIVARLEGVKRTGDGRAAACCPAHDDRHASLSVGEGADGRILLACHAGEGCPVEAITAALGIAVADLFPDPPSTNGHRHIAATYNYVDEDGTLLYQVVRFAPKQFRQRRPDGRGGWVWKLGTTRRVLYRLPAVLEAAKMGGTVYVVEGEKDVHALEAAGLVATCNPMGAGKWRPHYSKMLRGADVVIVQDRDEEGRKHAAHVMEQLSGVAASAQVVEAGEGKDAADHLASGLSVGEFVPVVLPDDARPAPVQDSPRPDVTIAQALDDVAAFIRRYVVITDDQAVACTLWVAHTYALEAAETTPYLAVSSPEKRSGKSRLLDVLEEVVRGPWRAVLPSEAVTFRKIEADTPTLLLDEVDAIWGPKAKEHEGLRALLNAGYRRRGSMVPRCVGPSLKVGNFTTYCPKALAGIGDLPDTVADRSIPIRMKRKRPADRVERFRAREVFDVGAELRNAISASVAARVDDLRDARPLLPAELDDRAQDAWEPLLAIADLAAGDWPANARRSAVGLSAGRDLDEGLGHRLLADCRLVFGIADHIPTSDLIERLSEIPDSPWGDYYGKQITGRRIADLLRPYGIRAKHKREGSTYFKADFEDSWARYAPQSVTSVTDRMVEPKTGDFKVSHETAGDTSKNDRNPAPRFKGDTCDTSNGENGPEPPSGDDEAEIERLFAKHPDLAGEAYE